MNVGTFLSRLAKVRKTGSDRWLACCPAHDDKRPSLSIRAEGERLLIHCWAGCPVELILTACGASWDDVMPEKALDHSVKPIRRPYPAADVLEAISNELLIVATAAGRLANGIEPTDAERGRLQVAAGRILEARRIANA